MINNIKDGIAYIHSLPKVHTDSDLSFIKKILDEFDNPQNDYDVIHITGTNGKGSVSHFIDKMLLNHNYKVGMFTSPYIVNFNERIQINDEFISDAQLLELINEVKNKVDAINDDFYLVEFEFVTVLGLLYFSRRQVDVAVVEVGIGGTHDKTNVVNAAISVINNIGMDHKQMIGTTLKDIAIEKSGIIKEGSQVILGDINPDLLSVFEKKSQSTNSKIHLLNQNFQIQNVVKNELGLSFDFSNETTQIADIAMASLADYQIKNAAVAIEAFALYQECHHVSMKKELVKSSIKQVRMLARMQIVNQQPLVILDGAHNVHAAKALMDALNEFYPNRRLNFLIAMMKDKEFTKVIDIFSNKSSNNITLTTFTENRSLKPDDVSDKRFVIDWQEFLRNFLDKNNDEILVVTGSLHFTSIVLNYFNQK